MIYLLPLNISNTQWVGGNQDVVYELDNIPGFSLTVKANSVTFPDGTHEGQISVTQVNADKVPMEPPNGLQPRFIITIQPPGAVFDPPAPITLPNVDGLAPGSITEMYSFDHDLGQFVSIGTGTVSEDGMILKSDPGVGVIKAGWHCGGDPVQTGCTNHCGDCKNCDGNCNCIEDNTNIPDNDTAGDCKKPGCSGGSPIEVNNDGDVPTNDTPGDCQRPGCSNGNPTPVPDDTDDPGEVCKECQNGTLIDLNGPLEGEPCQDCWNGIPQMRTDGTLTTETNTCCIGGVAVQKNPIIDLAQCPNRVDNPYEGKYFDGCSVPEDLQSLVVESDNPMGDENSSFSDACRFHDGCYGRCNSEKVNVCDETFENIMENVCDAAYSPIFDPIDYTQCHTYANGYWFAVRYFGDDAYINRQRLGCNCCGDNIAQ